MSKITISPLSMQFAKPAFTLQNSVSNGMCTPQSNYQFNLYAAQGPLPANTYAFTTAGPRYRATMGTCSNNVMAIGSPLRNVTGAFLACGSSQDRGNPQCY